MRRLLTVTCVLSFLASGMSAQRTDFEAKIRRHRSPDKRVLVDKFGTLTFDDSTRRFIFKSEAGDLLDIGYDDIGKVVFEVKTHMRGGVMSDVVQAASFPGLVAGTAMAGGRINNYWLYLDYKDHDGDKSVLLEVPKGCLCAGHR